MTPRYACSSTPKLGGQGTHGVWTVGTRVVAPVQTTVQGTTVSSATRTRTIAAAARTQAIALLPTSGVVVFEDKDVAGIRTWSPPV